MRIAFFDFVTHYGGAQRCTVDLAARVADTEEVHLIDAYGCCRDYVDAVGAAGLSLHVLHPQARQTEIGGTGPRRLMRMAAMLPNLLTVRSRLSRLVRELRPDAISTTGGKALALVASSRSARRVPCVYFLHGRYARHQVPPARRWLFRRLVKRFLSVSSLTRRNVIEQGVAPDRVTVVGNAIDTEAVGARAEGAFQSPPPRTDAAIRILMPATLLPAKGQRCAIRAAAGLVRQGRDVVLWLAGDGSEEFIARLRADAAEGGMADRLCLLGWRDDVPRLIRAATVVILPSHTEGLPISLMEAMALGRPVVATDVGGIGDLIRDEETGLLVDVEDDEALAVAVARLADHPDLARRLADRAYEHIRQNYDPATHAQSVLEVFRAAAGQSGGGA